MKVFIKSLLKRIGFKRLGLWANFLRRFFYFILDFFGCVFFLPYFLSSKIKPFPLNKVRKILIIRLDRIGDLILSTPAIRALRKRFPQAEIHLLVREYTRDLVINNPNLDRLLIYKRDFLGKDYDLAVALHPGIKQNYLTFRSGAKLRVGYKGWGGSFFLTHRLKDDRQKRIRHEVESALEVVGVLGCKIEDKHLDISLTEEGENFIKDFFKRTGLKEDDLIIVIHPGARQRYLRWKKEGFAEVAQRLISEDKAKVIFVGGEEEGGLVEEIISLMETKPLSFIGLKLTYLISLIKRSSVFIGNSSGPLHIATALRIPVVGIFGPTHPLDSYQEWGPWGEGHIVVSKNLNCLYCHPTDCKTFDCFRLITWQEVLEATRKQIKRVWIKK